MAEEILSLPKSVITEDNDYLEIEHNPEEQWEERSLGHLQDLIHQDFAATKSRKRGCKKHKLRKMKGPMVVIPEVIVELQDESSRESSLRWLSNFLLEKREDDPESYYTTGNLLYNSCSTMAILLQEVVAFFGMTTEKTVNIRASKRLANVLTLFQCIAANKETRQKFVKSFVPNYLIPLALFESSLEVYENVRAVALSVFGILCQSRESLIIQWAVESNVVQVCWRSIEIGNDLSKVIAMHVLEAILQDDSGISYICSHACNHLLQGLMKTWEHLVTHLSVDQNFSPRLLFHIVRCYILLCNHARGFSIVVKNLPNPLINGSFHDITEEFPVIGSLLQQLLLTVGKIDNCVAISLPDEVLLCNLGII